MKKQSSAERILDPSIPVGTRIKRMPILVLVIALFVVGAWTAHSSTPRLTDPNVHHEPGIKTASPVSLRPTRSERLVAELITVLPDGFEPKAINRANGRFLIAVDNRSGIKEVSLKLDRVSGNRLREVQMRTGKLSWRELVDLPPGTYRLTEESHPDWVCEITIRPK